MITLDFKGPFHYEHLNCVKNINKPGIYIWGFLYEFDNSGHTNPIDFNKANIPVFIEDGISIQPNWKFIPHYVGKSLSNMYVKRLKKHHNVRNTDPLNKGDADRYKRFSFDYLNLFYKDNSGFHPYTGKKAKKTDEILLKQNKIVYLNNENLPITDPKYKNIPDTLDEIVTKRKRNNFFVYYWDADKNKVNEIVEAYVFWSLKGKTISRTLPFEKVIPFMDCIAHKSDCNIFKSSPSSNFPGY